MSLFSEMMRRKRAARESALQTVLTNVTCDTLPPPQLPAVNTPNAVALPVQAPADVAVYSSAPAPETDKCTAEERALRDEKVEFVRMVTDYKHAHPKQGIATAVRHIAATRIHDFPLLSRAGKNGGSALSYANYRVWTEGTPKKEGLIDPATGRIDYTRKNILLPNYGKTKEVPDGDPAFWTALQGAIFQPQGEDIAATHRILALKWAIQYPGVRIPSLHQVYYYLKRRYPERMKLLARKGENYYDQNIRASVMRDPNTIRPNEGWVTDTQDCDFMIQVEGPDGIEAIRPKICVIMDIKSEYVLSVQFVTTPVCNEIIRNAFATAVFHYGRPKAFLTDNGRDYLKAGFTTPVVFTPDINGTKRYEHSILRELNIEHHIATKYNGRVKYVERFFKELAKYSKIARGYVGNKPENRPATAAVWEKEQNRPYLWNKDEACKFIGAMIDLYHRTPSKKSKYLNGLSPEQAFAPELRYRRADLTFDEYLRAFQMPDSKARKVDFRGPSVNCDGKVFVAVTEERKKLWQYDGRPVMVKFDQISGEHCFVYDLDGSYICECRTPKMLPYFDAPREELSAELERIRADRKYLQTLIRDATGDWHKLDPATAFQLPREAFLDKAKLRLLDSRYSVKGETHNPRIYVLPSELPSAPEAKPQIPTPIVTPQEKAEIAEIHAAITRQKQETPAEDDLSEIHNFITKRKGEDDGY